MTDLQAALSISQWDRLNEFLRDRHALAHNYDRLLDDLPVVTPYRPMDRISSLHLYVIRLAESSELPPRDQVFNSLIDHDILVNIITFQFTRSLILDD